MGIVGGRLNKELNGRVGDGMGTEEYLRYDLCLTKCLSSCLIALFEQLSGKHVAAVVQHDKWQKARH